MTPTFVGSVIALAAVAAFFGTRGPLRWWLPACLLLFLLAGVGGTWLLEKGPQKAFSWMPITVTHQAWAFNLLALGGIGGLAGSLVRGALALTSGSKTSSNLPSAPSAPPETPSQTRSDLPSDPPPAS